MTGSKITPKLITVLIMVVVMITGCTSGPGDPPQPTPSATPTTNPIPPRPFTVMTTDTIETADPAAVADTGSTMLTQNVFQRLMTLDPTLPQLEQLKPDAAQDCQYSTTSLYECTLRPGLHFSNGDPLTSADVKFSIQRALRLDVPGSSAPLMDSLRQIQTPNPLTVRFVLSRPDSQFSKALASPAASIVDSKIYNPDRIQRPGELIIGSGPFKVITISKTEVDLGKYLSYKGYAAAQVGMAVIKIMPDSASIEDAMAKQQVDVVWRGLSTAAQLRLQTQIAASKDQISTSGFSQLALPDARVEQLIWNPESRLRNNNALRNAIAAALQEDRTMDSVVPTTIPGHRPSFLLGGKADLKITWDSRIRLTLGYDPTAPNSLDLATQIRTRLEDTGGLSVLLEPNDPRADLQLDDRKAWVATGVAWLQPVTDNPLKSEQAQIGAGLEEAMRADPATPQLTRALATLQEAAAKENVVLPISEGPEYVYTGSRTTATANAFGPGWQLGLWGFKISQ